LIDPFDGDRVAFWTADGPITHAKLLARAAQLAARLPACPLVVNYCERRDAFATALVAFWMRGQTALFPADRGEHTFQALCADHAALYSLSDIDLPFDNPVNMRIDPDAPSPAGDADAAPADAPWGHLAAKVYTSGSVYPADIARCLADVPEPRVLVTTPVHLRALVESGTMLPAADRVISATAPLSADLAAAAEQRLGAQVWEIYGFTEAGSVGGRRTVATRDWTLREDFAARSEDGTQFVDWDAFDIRIPFPDVVQILDPGHIRLQGRAQDMVNIAGKRASLSGLSAQLVEIDGVRDGVFWLPSEDAGIGVVSRLMAFVVAPDTNESEIRAALQKRLDSAFMPRNIVFVDALPRNMTGKLTQGAMKTFAAQYIDGDPET
jgi:acyl-coenzyme A synthetase/AMP-(fatty) acid ligase